LAHAPGKYIGVDSLSQNREKILQLRVPLRGVTKERFLYVKEKYRVENSTDLVRLLIKEKYDEIRQKDHLSR